MLRDFDQPVVVEETVDDTYVNDPFVDEAGRDRRIDFVPYRMREELAARVSTVDRPGMTSGGLTGSPVTSVIFGLFGLSSFFFTGRWFFFFLSGGALERIRLCNVYGPTLDRKCGGGFAFYCGSIFTSEYFILRISII